MMASAIGKPMANVPTTVKVNAESKFTSERTLSTDIAACSTARKVKSVTRNDCGDGFQLAH
jgi:hypothetical protein